jgi:hypothetical protein
MSWQLFDRLAAFFKRQNIYRRDSLFVDQIALDKITSGGQFLNFAHQNALLEQTNLQINRLERYKDFDQMDEVGEITLALDLYADEASLVDPELKHTITVKAKSKRVKKALEELFHDTIMIDNIMRPMVRYLCKFGDVAFEIVPTKNRDGIMNIKFMNSYNFTRVETKYGDLVGFFFQDKLSAEPVFLHPWQVMHLRLTSFENIYHPYGRSILDGARKHFKQLRLMEDAALIYRITRAPEKRVFTIPVGNIPTIEVPQYIEQIARNFKKKQFFDPATGDVNERWHPLIQEDDFWLPQRADGTGPTITTLPGAENLDDIKDIEYFKKKMVSALKIPFDRVGLGEGQAADERSLSQVSPSFAKTIQWIQREVALGLKKVAIVHLALAGFSEDDLRGFDINMTASSAIDELYRIETWNSRAQVIDALRATEMFPKKWILRRFTDMTDDEIEQMEEEMKAAQQDQLPAMGGPMGGMGAPMGGPPPGPEGSPLPPGEPVPIDIGGPGGAPPGPGGEFGGEPMPGALPEGYNVNLEERMLMEYKRYRKDVDTPAIISEYYTSPSIYNTRRDEVISEDQGMNSGYDNLMNLCEFDGLTYLDDDGKEQVLIESYLELKNIVDAKKATKMLLTNNEPFILEEDHPITSADLPSRAILVD